MKLFLNWLFWCWVWISSQRYLCEILSASACAKISHNETSIATWHSNLKIANALRVKLKFGFFTALVTLYFVDSHTLYYTRT